MPLPEADLNQLLQALDELSPEEVALVQERLAQRQQPAVFRNVAASSQDLFVLPFDRYLALTDEEREALQRRAYQENQGWIDAELKRQGAAWLLVCGGEVLESSPALRDYPSRDKLLNLARQRGRVPFVFVREPLVEESVWTSLDMGDFYPTICGTRVIIDVVV
jgi:hypothetical protein